MKLVDILARELKVWPEGVRTISQSASGELRDEANYFLHEKVTTFAKDGLYQNVTRAEWQAAVDALKAPKEKVMGIDWSKAPAGCLEVGRNKWDDLAWLCADGYIYHHCNGCMVNWKTPRALKRSDFDVVDIRPDQEWNDEGLPPAGTACERRFPEVEGSSWRPVVICFIGEQKIFYRDEAGDEWANLPDDVEFRTIRTPEQIIADREREERIKSAQAWLHGIAQEYGQDAADKCEDILMEFEKRKQEADK